MNARALVGVLALTSSFAVFAGQPVEPAVPSQAEVSGWVESAYPALTRTTALPEQFHFGFVVTPDHKVLAHSAIIRPGKRPISEDLKEMFPSLSLAGSPMGGISQLASGSGNSSYGVVWVMVPAEE